MKREEFIKLLKQNSLTAEESEAANQLLKIDESLLQMRLPFSLLLEACMNSNLEMVKLLVEAGANPNEKSFSMSPLTYSSTFVSRIDPRNLRYREIFLCLDKASKEDRNQYDMCEVSEEFDREYIRDLVKDLRSKYPEGNITIDTPFDDNRDGNNALHLACFSANADLVLKLIAVGADLNHRNNFGKTALDLVFEKDLVESSGHKMIAEILIDHGAQAHEQYLERCQRLASSTERFVVLSGASANRVSSKENEDYIVI